MTELIAGIAIVLAVTVGVPLLCIAGVLWVGEGADREVAGGRRMPDPVDAHYADTPAARFVGRAKVPGQTSTADAVIATYEHEFAGLADFYPFEEDQ